MYDARLGVYVVSEDLGFGGDWLREGVFDVYVYCRTCSLPALFLREKY